MPGHQPGTIAGAHERERHPLLDVQGGSHAAEVPRQGLQRSEWLRRAGRRSAMIVVQLVVVLAAIYLGARLGGIAIGFAGGLGVLVLALLGVTPGALPLDVVSIIISVITAIAAMQVAGGMDYLVDLADRILRRNPKYLSFLAPVITYLMTLMAGTGFTAFSTIPAITE